LDRLRFFCKPANSGVCKGATRIADYDPAYVGLSAVSSREMNENTEGCDVPKGTLTSPVFRVNSA
tara:strand:- start:1074 stop:1268 length:195 start_codon:yes stop_codon:yes gene_type:complete